MLHELFNIFNYRVLEDIERGSLWHPADLKKSYKG